MTDREKLIALAERCEKATGPSRELDLAVGSSLGVDSYYLKNWTASLDAAMTLVPEGWRMAALCEREPWFCRLETTDFDSVTWGKGSDWITDVVAGQETTAKAATPALALCAAALRARADTSKETNNDAD